MNGWHTNEVFPDRDVWQYYLHMPVWFRFALDYKIFSWEGKELDAIKVKDVAELSKFLEMIDELGEQVQNIPPYVKKSTFQDELIKTLGIESSLITEEQLDYSIKKVKECCEISSFKKYGTSNIS